MKTRSREPTPPRNRGANRLADILAGISVALVLLPQSLAYAELAGMPAHHGLYVAAVAPLLAAIFASSPFLATGPAAITSLLAFGALGGLGLTAQSETWVSMAALLTLLVGVFRVLFGLFKAGALAFFLSPPVLKGFTVGAAVLIAGSQLPTAIGVSGAEGGTLQRAGHALINPELWHLPSIAVTAVTMLIILVGKKIHALFPGVLVAAIGGLVFSMAGGFDGAILETVPRGFPIPSVDMPWGDIGLLVVPAFVIALVGFAEPTAIARTYAAADRTRWDANREFIAQGVANIASGLVKGYPVGASFSRSAVNRLAGARTRWAGAVTGVVVIAFLPAANILEPLPRPVLAGIIIAAVIKLFDLKGLFTIWRYSWPQAFIATTTFVLTVALAPRIEQAVLAGLVLSIVVHSWREIRIRIVTTHRDGRLLLAPKGILWFASADALEERFLEQLSLHPDTDEVRVDLSGLGRIDYTGAVALHRLIQRAEDGGNTVTVCGAPPQTMRILGKVCPELIDGSYVDKNPWLDVDASG
ncbi:MAG: SulP family sulfate permease [Myxococcota bacterium]|jgi:SulP family sulfate permease